MKNLRKRREAAGLSRYQLAVRAGISPETIEGVERGRTSTSVDKAMKLAKALGTTVEDLMGQRIKAS